MRQNQARRIVGWLRDVANAHRDSAGLQLGHHVAVARSNQGAFVFGKAGDAAQRAPGLSTGKASDPRQEIAATTFYDQIKAFFAQCVGVLRGQGDAQGGRALRAGQYALDAPLGCEPRDC